MNELQIIDNVECYEENGTAYLKLENVARGLGFIQEKNGTEYVRWETVFSYLNDIGFSQDVGKDGFIPENIFYRLAMKAKNETAERFQAKVADEIIPQIRKTGGYALAKSPTELMVLMAQELDKQAKAVLEVKEDVKRLESKIMTVPNEYYTVAGYANLKGKRVDVTRANQIGRYAANLSRKWGYEIGHVSDARYGTVNSYHMDILRDAFRGIK